jgi:hypothetical protein
MTRRRQRTMGHVWTPMPTIIGVPIEGYLLAVRNRSTRLSTS